MKIEGSKILVIGGAGCIGSRVVSALLQTEAAEVVIYDNFVRGEMANIAGSLADPSCTVWPHGGDIRDIDLLNDAMAGMDGVFHLAAMWLLHCRDYPRTAFHVNIEGTFNVLEACVKNKIQRLVYSSSASVYGDAVEAPMTEAHPFNNRNFYGATKIAGEAMCRAYHDRYYIGLRYMNVYGSRRIRGEGYSDVVDCMLNKIRAGEPPVINGDGSQAYDFIHVDDAARANRLAMESETTDVCLNIGTGVRTTVLGLCETMLELAKSTEKIQFRPYSSDDARRSVQNRIACTYLAEKVIGFSDFTTLREGLQLLRNENCLRHK